MPSKILLIALRGLLTASVTVEPARWKILRVLSSAGNDRGLAGSSPGVEGAKGDISVSPICLRLEDDGEGGKSWIADSTLASNSSCEMLLRLEASIVSMNAIAPLKLDK
jgi:hypothetical protein